MSGVKKVDLKKLKPYGDIMNDGVVQLSFTLPVEVSLEAQEAARQLVSKMGFEDIKIATMQPAATGFSMFVVYAKVQHIVDFTQIKVVKVESPTLSMKELDALLEAQFDRKIVVLGACTGYDAHTVGIDAIMNMKGFAGDYGLERYKNLDARNLGAQVLNDELLKKAVEANADVILVSKVVTQHDIHLSDLKDLIARAEQMGLRDRFIFIAGGPRLSHQIALECGFDAGFGVGSKPSEVASYFVDELIKRKNKKGTP